MLYTINYEYYDGRGFRRTKKILCNGKDNLKSKCRELQNLKVKKPISEPNIYETVGIDTYGKMLNYKQVLKED